MEIKKCLLTKNDCYKKGQKITPKGIVVHSTGANNPNLKRYVQPDDGILGKNKYNNHWNRSGLDVCVHAFIGKDANGVVRCYQTLPFNYACWGVGKGKKGSYNYNPAYIQFEICEDNLKDKEYFTKAFDVAIEFCAYLVKEYKLSVDNVVSHKEAHTRGYGSNHSDCDHWLKKYGKDMNWFRSEVEKRLKTTTETTKEPTKKPTKKSVEAIAKEVIAGKWGNGSTRKKKLEEAGYNYSEVQGRVNEILKGKSDSKEYYTIKKGDTLSSIAKKFDTSVDKLVKLNDIKDPDKIYTGDKIRVK
jgi:LysM repeat protein